MTKRSFFNKLVTRMSLRNRVDYDISYNVFVEINPHEQQYKKLYLNRKKYLDKKIPFRAEPIFFIPRGYTWKDDTKFYFLVESPSLSKQSPNVILIPSDFYERMDPDKPVILGCWAWWYLPLVDENKMLPTRVFLMRNKIQLYEPYENYFNLFLEDEKSTLIVRREKNPFFKPSDKDWCITHLNPIFLSPPGNVFYVTTQLLLKNLDFTSFDMGLNRACINSTLNYCKCYRFSLKNHDDARIRYVSEQWNTFSNIAIDRSSCICSERRKTYRGFMVSIHVWNNDGEMTIRSAIAQ